MKKVFSRLVSVLVSVLCAYFVWFPLQHTYTRMEEISNRTIPANLDKKEKSNKFLSTQIESGVWSLAFAGSVILFLMFVTTAVGVLLLTLKELSSDEEIS
ncbi:MAG: hypothetical protein WCA07_13860 [Gloeobacterales cyanobacterium]